MRISVTKGIPYLLLLLGILFCANGLWLKAKAEVAQLLLQRAWTKTLEGEEQAKPWPWADTWPVARLQVGRLGIDCIILEGESGEVLAFGPGHISRSSRPLAEGNCALVGHRDTSFTFLKDLRKGDIIHLQDGFGKKMDYQVLSKQVKDREQLFLEETVTPWLTLITCYPLNGLVTGGPLRMVVFAKEIVTKRKPA